MLIEYTKISTTSDILLYYNFNIEVFTLVIAENKSMLPFDSCFQKLWYNAIRKNKITILKILSKIKLLMPEIKLPINKKYSGKTFEYRLYQLDDLIAKLFELDASGVRVNLSYVVPSLVEDFLLYLENSKKEF